MKIFAHWELLNKNIYRYCVLKLWLPWQQNLKILQIFENLIVWNHKAQGSKFDLQLYLLSFFQVFSSTGRRPASLCHGPLSVVPPSVRALTFSLNIFFAETTYRILMKFHRNVPTMVLFRISWNNLIPSKTLVAMATKLKIFWNLWKSSCQKP